MQHFTGKAHIIMAQSLFCCLEYFSSTAISYILPEFYCQVQLVLYCKKSFY
jgi:hypothetical protein